MAFEKLRTIVITATAAHSFGLWERLRVTVAKGRSPKIRIEEGIANGVLSRSSCPLNSENFSRG
jgi:hypothetical protein